MKTTNELPVQMRKENFEYLRIICTLMIVAFHSVYYGGIDTSDSLSLRGFVADILYHFGELGASCFFLISGYFLPKTAFNSRKALLLVLEIEFYVVVSRLVLMSFGQPVQWDLRVFFPIMNNEYWFIHVYLLIYILQPRLKQIIPTLDKSSFTWLILSQMMIWSLLPTFFFTPVFHLSSTESVPYYNRYLWFLLVYLIGCYIRVYGIPRPQKDIAHFRPVFKHMVFTLPFLLVILTIIYGELGIIDISPTYFWPPNSTLMVMMSISLFCTFKNWQPKQQRKWVTYIASCSLGIYLMHDGALRPFLWNELLRYQSDGRFGTYSLHLFRAVIFVFAMGIAVDSIRKLMEKHIIIPLLDSIPKIKRRYSHE